MNVNIKSVVVKSPAEKALEKTEQAHEKEQDSEVQQAQELMQQQMEEAAAELKAVSSSPSAAHHRRMQERSPSDDPATLAAGAARVRSRCIFKKNLFWMRLYRALTWPWH